MPGLFISLMLLLASPLQATSPLSSATRGITGVITIEVPAGTLRGRADLDLDSPLLVRVASIEQRDDLNIHELEFIGTTPGVFDLREVLVFADGSSIDRLPPLPVQIVSNLEDHAASDLSMTIPPSTTFVGGYRIWIIVIGVLWILIPVITIILKLNQSEPLSEEEPRTPTLAEQLSPLVNAACNRTLSITEQAKLELLLYWHWQEELGLETNRPDAVARLRRHEVAGLLTRSAANVPILQGPRG